VVPVAPPPRLGIDNITDKAVRHATFGVVVHFGNLGF
jgi:hypothetical protein